MFQLKLAMLNSHLILLLKSRAISALFLDACLQNGSETSSTNVFLVSVWPHFGHYERKGHWVMAWSWHILTCFRCLTESVLCSVLCSLLISVLSHRLVKGVSTISRDAPFQVDSTLGPVHSDSNCFLSSDIGKFFPSMEKCQNIYRFASLHTGVRWVSGSQHTTALLPHQ